MKNVTELVGGVRGLWGFLGLSAFLLFQGFLAWYRLKLERGRLVEARERSFGVGVRKLERDSVRQYIESEYDEKRDLMCSVENMLVRIRNDGLGFYRGYLMSRGYSYGSESYKLHMCGFRSFLCCYSRMIRDRMRVEIFNWFKSGAYDGVNISLNIYSDVFGKMTCDERSLLYRVRVKNFLDHLKLKEVLMGELSKCWSYHLVEGGKRRVNLQRIRGEMGLMGVSDEKVIR